MKNRVRTTLVIAVAAVLLVTWPTLGQPKGPKVTVTGEVVDLWCYLEGGDQGAKHKECATACVKSGTPIGIVDAKGDVYVAVGIKDHQPGSELLLSKMAQTVTVSGTLVKKGGSQLLYISSVK